MKSFEAIYSPNAFLDLNPVMFGYCTASPDRPVDISERFYYLIHYVVSGKGYLYINDTRYTVTKGQIFIIPECTANYYVADEKEPWSYIWIAFTGRLAKKFGELPTIMDLHSNIFLDMMESTENLYMQQEYLVQKLFELYIELFQSNISPNYSSLVKKHIDLNYNNPNISVASIATSLGLNRSYLSRIFKKEIGISIQDYIIKTRISKSIILLEEGKKISETAMLVGYSDPFNFSKVFKQRTGLNPSDYKPKNKL